MPRSPLVVAAATIGAATLLVVSALLLFGPDPGSTTSVGPGVPEPGSTSTAHPDSSGTAGGRASGRTSPSASSARAGTPGPTSSSGATGTSPSSRSRSELQAPDPDATAQPGPEDYSLPPIPESLPASADTRNAVVAAPRSVVASSTRSPLDGAVQVAIVATKHASTDAVLRYYRGRFARFGFTEFQVPAVGGSSAVAFRRDSDRVVVTVTPGTRGSVDYSVIAILHSARS